MEGEYITLAIDNGTSSVRAGFYGGKGPRTVIPNIIGRSLATDADTSKYYIGDDLLALGHYSRQSPMEKGVVVNWDHMEMVWNHTITTDLRADAHDHAVVLTDMTFSPKSQREKMTQIMFETFDSAALKVLDQAVAGLGFMVERTGRVIEMGCETIRIVPVYNGHAIAHHGIELNYGGKDVTDYLITVGSERFRCTEVLFNPSLMGKTDPGLHRAVFDVLMKLSPDIRDEFTRLIFVCGGPSMTLGLVDRLRAELKMLWPEQDQELRVVAPPGSHIAPYLGASYVESTPQNIKQLFITKDQYDEDGPRMVHWICY